MSREKEENERKVANAISFRHERSKDVYMALVPPGAAITDRDHHALSLKAFPSFIYIQPPPGILPLSHS